MLWDTQFSLVGRLFWLWFIAPERGPADVGSLVVGAFVVGIAVVGAIVVGADVVGASVACKQSAALIGSQRSCAGLQGT